MSKINVVKVASIAASVLGVAGTLLANWASAKTMDQTITKKVAEALANQTKES